MYPDTIAELLEALTLQEANINTYKTEVGATDEDITELAHDIANLTILISNAEIAETDKQVTNLIKNTVYNGDPNEAVSPYPSFAIQPLPFPLVKAGVNSRYNERRRRYKAAKGYTKEIGIALGLEKPSSGSISPADLVGAAKFKDLGNYQFEAEYKKQGMSGMAFQYRIKATEKWNIAVNALQSPIAITISEPEIDNAVVQIEIRCRFLKGNNQVGQWSPIYLLTVTP